MALSPPFRPRALRVAALIAVIAACAVLLWHLSPRPALEHKTTGLSRHHPSIPPLRSTDAAPRRRLPTRTEADVVAGPPPGSITCPLVVLDADEKELVKDPEARLPPVLTVRVTPSVVPPLSVLVDGEEASLPAAAVQKLRQLPFRDGTIIGEAPDVGMVAIRFDGSDCSQMQVLLVGPPEPDAPRCELEDGLTLLDIQRVVYASGPRAGRPISVRPWQGAVVLEDVPESGDGWVQVSDHPPIPLSWDAAGCDPIAPIGTATVLATVVNPRPGGPTWIRGCGVSEYLPPEEDSIELQVPAVPCALEAWRTDGALRALSPLATLDPEPNTTIEVTLSLPEEQMAGLGIRFETGDTAVTVAGVWRDSPAWHAGMRRGDRIVSVDGEPVGGLQDSDFIVLGTGPVGTVAELLVEDAQGTLETIEIERAPLQGRLN